jgi:peroxiredoxin
MTLHVRLLPVLLVALLAGSLSAAEVGKPVADIRLTSLDGNALSLHDLKGKVVVAVFLSFECPISNSYTAPLSEMSKEYAGKNVVVLGFCPTQDAVAELAKQGKEFQLAFPIYRDADLSVARALGARTVPEAFILDGKMILRYRGRIDDGYAKRVVKKQKVEHHDLRDALDAVLAGKEINSPVTEAVGCPILYPRDKVATGKVTFHRDVLPIVQNRCQQCHRPGEVAPFSLLTYKQAVTWADDIKDYTKQRKMPPWKPSEGAPMKSERRMSDKEIATLAAWIDGGTPEGDPKDAPPPRKFTDGWTLGPPDLILEPKEEMTIAATGGDIFRCFVLPTNLKADKFVVAYEVRAGNPRVVHHTLHFLDTQKRAIKREERETMREKRPNEKDTGPGYNSRMGPGFFPPEGDVGGWAPGLRPHYLPEGVGYYLPRGSDVVMQVHYHRTGRVEKDRTRLGLYFAKKPADKPLQAVGVPGRFVFIPAGEENFKVKGDMWLAQDAMLHTTTPHMHLIGKSIKVTMTPPNGPTVMLVNIPDWDYNWQETYFFKEPIKAPAGTKLSVEAVYDNSAKNPNNPSNPPRTVTLGEGTLNEMCFGFLGATTDDGKAIGFRFTPTGFILRRPGLLLPKRD